jgi:hypothetical protein
LLGDTLGGNPAALPTLPTPFGIEGLASSRSSPKRKTGFSTTTVKGFEGFGFGIGSWTDGTFSAPDFPAHFLGSVASEAYLHYQQDPPSALGLRLGTTAVLPQGPFPKGMRISLGGSVGLGRIRGQVSPQFGGLVKFFFLGLGYSESYERISEFLPNTRISTISAGLPLGPLYAGFSRVRLKSVVNKTYANVYSLRWNGPKWTFFGNAKIQRDHRGEPDRWIRGGLQRRIGKRLGLGYEYGLYRYSHSAILQIYL